jgi:hypothetical protein
MLLRDRIAEGGGQPLLQYGNYYSSDRAVNPLY